MQIDSVEERDKNLNFYSPNRKRKKKNQQDRT